MVPDAADGAGGVPVASWALATPSTDAAHTAWAQATANAIARTHAGSAVRKGIGIGTVGRRTVGGTCLAGRTASLLPRAGRRGVESPLRRLDNPSTIPMGQ